MVGSGGPRAAQLGGARNAHRCRRRFGLRSADGLHREAPDPDPADHDSPRWPGSGRPARRADHTAFLSRTRSEEHTSELQSLMRLSYAVFCLKKKKQEYTISNNSTISHIQQT